MRILTRAFSINWDLTVPPLTRYRLMKPLEPGQFVDVDFGGPSRVLKDYQNGLVKIVCQSGHVMTRTRDHISPMTAVIL